MSFGHPGGHAIHVWSRGEFSSSQDKNPTKDLDAIFEVADFAI